MKTPLWVARGPDLCRICRANHSGIVIEMGGAHGA
jgi:hypothetical protein